MDYDILVIGDMNVDLLVSGNAQPQFGQVEKLVEQCVITTGGSANIFASQFARLGGRIGVIGKVGNDAFGELLVNNLKQAGVDTSQIIKTGELQTGLSICLIEGDDRAILTYSGSIQGISVSDIREEFLGKTRHWHIASFYLLENLLPHWPVLCKNMKKAGLTISLDTNWDPHKRWDSVRELLPFVDIFLPNEEEAREIAGVQDTIESGKILASRGPLVVIKRGESGAVAFQEGQVQESHPYPSADTPIVDSVGAGDSFDAGFMRSWLLGHSLKKSLELGNKCGYSSLLGAGGVASQLNEVIS